MLLSNGVARGKETGNARHGMYGIDRCNWTGNSTCRTTFVQQHIVGIFHHNYAFNKRIAKGHKRSSVFDNCSTWKTYECIQKYIITVYVVAKCDAEDVEIFVNTYMFV